MCDVLDGNNPRNSASSVEVRFITELNSNNECAESSEAELASPLGVISCRQCSLNAY